MNAIVDAARQVCLPINCIAREQRVTVIERDHAPGTDDQIFRRNAPPRPATVQVDVACAITLAGIGQRDRLDEHAGAGAHRRQRCKRGR